MPVKNANCSVEKRTTRTKLGKTNRREKQNTKKNKFALHKICSTELNGKCEKGCPQKVKATLDAKFMRTAAAARLPPYLPYLPSLHPLRPA